MKRKLVFVETQDGAETSVALDNFQKVYAPVACPISVFMFTRRVRMGVARSSSLLRAARFQRELTLIIILGVQSSCLASLMSTHRCC